MRRHVACLLALCALAQVASADVELVVLADEPRETYEAGETVNLTVYLDGNPLDVEQYLWHIAFDLSGNDLDYANFAFDYSSSVFCQLIPDGCGTSGYAEINMDTATPTMAWPCLHGDSFSMILMPAAEPVVIAHIDVTLPRSAGEFEFSLVNPNSDIAEVEGGTVLLSPTQDLKDAQDCTAFDGNLTGGTISFAVADPESQLFFSYPNGVPELFPPGETSTVTVQIEGMEVNVDPGSPTLHLTVDGGRQQEIPLAETEPSIYEAVVGPFACGQRIAWSVSATADGEEFTDPPNGTNSADAYAELIVTLDEDFETPAASWTVENENLQSGAWEQAEPIPTYALDNLVAPAMDASPDGVMAFITENGVSGEDASVSDVDGGPTHLISPAFDMAGVDGFFTFAAWFIGGAEGGTPDLKVWLSNDDGTSWVLADTITDSATAWKNYTLRVGDHLEPTSDVRIRFSATDQFNGLTEAGIDEFLVETFVCDPVFKIVSSDPPDGAVDARQPFEPDGSDPQGWSEIELCFSEPVPGMSSGEFAISVEGSDVAPEPLDWDATTDACGVLTFSAMMEPVTWLTVSHSASGSSVTLGYLPGDVCGNGVATPSDVLVHVDALNGIFPRPIYSTDTNRSGIASAADLLRTIDLLNGADAFPVYNGVVLP